MKRTLKVPGMGQWSCRTGTRREQQAQRTWRGRQPRQRGFTLVELLVVISIIALLISILLPSLKSAREQAKMVKCMAHQRGIGQAGMSFATDHNDRFQLVTNAAGVDKADKDHEKYAYTSERELMAWPVALAQASGMQITANWQWGVRADNPTQAVARQKYISDGFEHFICPADKVRLATTFYPRGTGNGMLFGPGNPATGDDDSPAGGTSYWGRLSYGINEDIVGCEVKSNLVGGSVGRWMKAGGLTIWARGEMNGAAGDRLQGQLSRIYDPATVLLITDSGANSEQDLLAATTADADNQASLINLIISAQWNLTASHEDQLGTFMHYWYNRVPYQRHPKGQLGVVFADFHAETVRPVTWQKNSQSGREQPWTYSSNVRISPYPGSRPG